MRIFLKSLKAVKIFTSTTFTVIYIAMFSFYCPITRFLKAFKLSAYPDAIRVSFN